MQCPASYLAPDAPPTGPLATPLCCTRHASHDGKHEHVDRDGARVAQWSNRDKGAMTHWQDRHAREVVEAVPQERPQMSEQFVQLFKPLWETLAALDTIVPTDTDTTYTDTADTTSTVEVVETVETVETAPQWPTENPGEGNAQTVTSDAQNEPATSESEPAPQSTPEPVGAGAA